MLFNPANNTLWASQGTNASGFPGSWALGLGLMFGFIIMILTGMNNLRIEFHKMLIIMVVFMALWEVQTSATVENMLTGNSVTVQGIPIGIVYPAAIFSTIAYDAAEEIGQADQNAGNNNPSLFTGSYNSNYGFAGPLALTYKLRGLYSVFNEYDSPLSGSVAQYVDHCIIPQASVVDSGELIDSPDLAATLFTGPNAIAPSNNQVPIDVNGSNQATAWQSVPCSTAQSTLSNAWSTFYGGAGSNSLNNVVSMKTQSNGKTGVDASTAESVLQTMFTTTANGGQNFIGNLILNCAAEAGNAQAASDMSSSADVTDPSTLSPYCTTKAAALGRQQAMNAGSASLFESNMIPTMALLQFLFFAMAPLTLIIAAMMGVQGLPMLGKYMIFGAWTESWIPVAQIINDYIQQTTNQLYANIQTAAAATSITTPGGGTMTMSATSSANIPMILTHAMNALSMADMMMSATPIITLVLLTGSYFALTQLGSKISGNDVVDKNMSESTPTNGTNVMASGAYGVGVNNPGTVGGSYGSTAPLNAVSYSASSGINATTTQSEAAQASLTRQATESAGITAQNMSSLINSQSAGVQSALTQTAGAQHAAKVARHAQTQYMSDFGFSKDNALTFAGILSGELATGGQITGEMVKGLVGKLGGSATGQQAAKFADSIKSGDGLKQLEDFSHAEEALSSNGLESKLSHTDQKGTAAAIGTSTAKTRSLLSARNAVETQSAGLAKAAVAAQSAGGNINFDVANTAPAITDTAAAIGHVSGNEWARMSIIAATGRNGQASEDAALAQFDQLHKRGMAIYGGSNEAATGYALISMARSMPNKAEATEMLARATGHHELAAAAAGMARDMQNIQRAVAGAGVAIDPSATGSVPDLVSQVGGATGAPSAGATQAQYQADHGAAASNVNNSTGAADWNPSAVTGFFQGAQSDVANHGPGAKLLNQAMGMFGSGVMTPQQAQQGMGKERGAYIDKAARLGSEDPNLTSLALGATGLGGMAAALALGGGLKKMMGNKAAQADLEKGMSPEEQQAMSEAANEMADGKSFGDLTEAQQGAVMKATGNLNSVANAKITQELGTKTMDSYNSGVEKMLNGKANEITPGERASIAKVAQARQAITDKLGLSKAPSGGEAVDSGGDGIAQGNSGAEEANGQVPGESVGADPLDPGSPPSVPVEKTVVPMFPGQDGYQGPSNSPGSKE
ncbi:conjugal transfer protein TraG N-terminal domain-containing protein [Acidithiobacillus ferrooxidans]|nr:MULTISPECIES: conjugal transfer protein TraG N-terminal domain-containing protein [Acidithiobacillus]MBN6744937.1 conjugal transfer protein TraG N-terminal domain-containing protein [Acidithiobacillus sp. MC2.2]